MTEKLQRLLALVLLACPAMSFALGLGDIRLNSTLNEPLDAQIDLVSATADELSSLRAGLASRETFTRYGIERPQSLNELQFKVGKSDDGRNVLFVRSRQAIADPFLTFLVEVNWARGRLLREYTVLMDPPVYMPGAAEGTAPVAAPRAGVSQDDSRSGVVERPAVAEAAPAAPARVSRPAGTVSADGSSYTVRSNDTLWQIASGLRPGGAADVNRMMLALYRANPQAFNGNINQLRAGAILRIPDSGEFDAVSSNEAGSEVRRQYAEWRANRGAAPAGGDSGRLRLVTPTEGGEGTAATAASGADGKVLSDRVRALESQLAESRRMIELKDAELARLQQQLGQKPTAQTPPPAATPEPSAAAPETPTSAAPEAAPAETPTEQTPAAQEPAAATETPPATPPAATPAAESSWLDWLIDKWLFVLGGLLVVGALVFGVWHKSRQPDYEAFGKLADAAEDNLREPRFDREPVTAPVRTTKAKEDTFLVEESGERPQPMAARTAELPRIDKPKGKIADDTLSSETAINLDQGDPLAEADFHMAYGLYDQAADLVRIAIEREPQRRDLKLKLLEIFFVWGNKDAFLQTARQLHDTRSEAAAGEWEKIVIMGKQISADDALFARAGSGGAAGADVDLNLEGGENRIDLDVLGSPGDAGGGIDLDLGSSQSEDASVQTGESLALSDNDALDFVLDAPVKGSDSGATTREMAARTLESPTIESETFPGGLDAPTVETPALRGRDSPTIKEKIDSALFRKDSISPDQTAELALDDLGLDLDSLGESGDTGTLDSLEETDHPADAPTMLAGMDEKSRRLLEDAESRSRGPDPDRTIASETLPDQDKVSPTGTWVLDDKTMAATMALPGAGADSGATGLQRALGGGKQPRADVDATAELSALDGDDMDLDLDRLEAALQSDTVRQPRKGSTEEERFSTDVFKVSDMTATDIDLDVTEIKRDREPTRTERIPAADMSLPELEPVTMSEVGTKLDLARAYMDMGDPEGARSILEEVLHEGSATQQQEAQRLIESLPG